MGRAAQGIEEVSHALTTLQGRRDGASCLWRLRGPGLFLAFPLDQPVQSERFLLPRQAGPGRQGCSEPAPWGIPGEAFMAATFHQGHYLSCSCLPDQQRAWGLRVPFPESTGEFWGLLQRGLGQPPGFRGKDPKCETRCH